MNVSINGSIGSFLLAVLVYFLFSAVINALITEPQAKRMFEIILLIICLVIALAGSLFIHV